MTIASDIEQPDVRQATWQTRRWWLGLVLLAVAAGYCLQVITVPGGWLLGPMVVAIAGALMRPQHVKVPSWILRMAQATLGILIASSFRISSVPVLVQSWLPIVLIVAFTLAVSLAAGIVLSRITSLDRQTAAFGTLPGGASSMVAMSLEMQADTRIVALMQYLRMITVVATASLITRFVVGVPSTAAAGPVVAHAFDLLGFIEAAGLALAGVYVGPRLRLPAATLLGPVLMGIIGIASGSLHTAWPAWPVLAIRPVWPAPVIHAAYIIVGLYVGLLFDRDALRRARRLIPVFILTTLVLIGLCLCSAALLCRMTGTDFLTAYLATTPGGLDSITVIALGGGADMSLILVVQMARLLSIVFLGPVLVRWLLGRHEPLVHVQPKAEDAEEFTDD